MQLYSVSIGDIENDIVNYFSSRYGTDPSALTPATDLKKTYNFKPPAWAQLGNALSHLPWMVHLGVILSANDMMTVSTVAQLAYCIYTKLQHVVIAPTVTQVTPVKSLMSLSAHAVPSPGGTVPKISKGPKKSGPNQK